jgi:hypothetical protein
MATLFGRGVLMCAMPAASVSIGSQRRTNLTLGIRSRWMHSKQVRYAGSSAGWSRQLVTAAQHAQQSTAQHRRGLLLLHHQQYQVLLTP